MYYGFVNIFYLIEEIMPLFILGIIEFIFRIIIIAYIAKDAQRKNANPILWCLFTFFFPLISVIFYLILVYKKPIINKNNINVEESKDINISQFNNSNNFNNINNIDTTYENKKPTLLITFLVFKIIVLISSFTITFEVISDIMTNIEYSFYNNGIYNSFDCDDFWD